MDQLPIPTPNGYVSRAAQACGINLALATVDEHVQVFRVALYNIEISIREAQADGMVVERFAKEDLRPDLKFISLQLRGFQQAKATVSIPGGHRTLAAALEQLDHAISYLNAAARMFLAAQQTNNEEHWAGYFKSYAKFAYYLREAQLQLETDEPLTA